MAIGAWVLMLAAGIGVGAALCAGLVVPRRSLWIVTAAGALSLLALLAGLTGIWRTTAHQDADVASGFIALGAAIGGFALFAALLPALTRPRRHPIAIQPGDDDGRLRVIVLADAEPEVYSPVAVTEILEDLAESDVPLPPEAARPLVYASERSRYRGVGGSPMRPMVRHLVEVVGALVAARDADALTLPAFCTGLNGLTPTIAAETAQGARTIVVAPCSVSRTRAVDRAHRAVDDLGLEAVGISVRFASPLWESEAVGALVAQHTIDAFEGEPQQEDGVVLVCEGEPAQWQRGFSTTMEQETFFSQRVRAALIEAGFEEQRVRVGWLEWEEPDVHEVLRHLAALGSRRIALVPTGIAFDSVETRIDLHAAADRVALETESEVFVLPGWGDDPVVAEAICESVFAALADPA